MSADATHILIMKVMTDKYCHAERRDLEACTSYYIPQHTDGSYVDMSIQRKGQKQCEGHQQAYQMCVADEKKQQGLVRTVYKMQQCKDERNLLVKCQQAAGGNGKTNGQCDSQFYGMMECGLIHMIKGMQGGGGGGQRGAGQQQQQQTAPH